jgi:hypothetical protein
MRFSEDWPRERTPNWRDEGNISRFQGVARRAQKAVFTEISARFRSASEILGQRVLLAWQQIA